MVHAVDIDTGLTFDDLPADFLRALGEDIATRRSGTPGGPALLVEPTDDPVRWPVRGPAGPITVTGTLANLVAYLAGRPAVGVRVASGDLPPLPPWL